MERLFSYGTLQLPEVQTATFTDGLPGTLAWVWHESLAMPALIPTGGWGRPVAVTFTAGFGPPGGGGVALPVSY